MDFLRDLLRDARRLSSAADLDGAIQIYHEILRKEPNYGLALHELGNLMSRRGDFGRAVEFLERAPWYVGNPVNTDAPEFPAFYTTPPNAWSKVTWVDKFTDYVMFQAAGGGIWVPEASFTWSLNGTVTLLPAGWTPTVPASVNAPKVNHAAWPTAWNDLAYIYDDYYLPS